MKNRIVFLKLLKLIKKSRKNKRELVFHETKVKKFLYKVGKILGYQGITWVDENDNPTRWNGGGGP